ncbi:hypothetical protein ACV348_33100, partial [Pseudomonas aeruginosa]
QPEEIERCIQAGMNECLIKPIGLDVLEERLLALGFAAGQRMQGVQVVETGGRRYGDGFGIDGDGQLVGG